MVWHPALDIHSESVLAAFVDLLIGPAARRALAHRDIAAVFRRDIAAVFRFLCNAGVSQYSVAHATGQRQPEVSEIISSGRQVQSVAVLERIADGLGVPRGWMGLAYAPDRAPTTERKAQTKGCSDANLLRHAMTVLSGKPVFGPAEPIRVRHCQTPVPRRIGLADVEDVVATADRLSDLAGDFGGIPVTSALTAHVQASETLLGAIMRDQVRQRLLIALSDTHRAAGGAAAGAGLRDLSRQHTTSGPWTVVEPEVTCGER
jgi:transcriptional regulator with XRE-family HTH domain